MNLGVFLSLGDSFTNMTKSGQDSRFKKYYVNVYAKQFDHVYIFTYENEKVTDLPKNVTVIPNKYGLHRYIYGLILPFLNIAEMESCDVVRVFHLHGTLPSIVARIFLGKKFVFNYAYDYFDFALIENKRLQAWLFKLIEPLALLLAGVVLVAEKARLEKFQGEKYHYLPNGVDLKFFKPKSYTSTIKKRYSVLSVGRLERQKNYHNLIKSLKGLPVNLTIVGNGSLKKELIKLAGQNNIKIQLVDKVSNELMPRIYRAADIFTLPSLQEGQPKVLLEAMACALAVVGTDVAGTREIIDDGKDGLLVGTSVEELRNGILKLIKNKSFKKFGQNARKKIEIRFDLNKLMSEEVRIIKGLTE